MTPETRTFNLTEQQLTEGRKKLSDEFSVHLINDSGTIDKDGCKGTYDIAHNVNDVEGQASVTITITHLPIFVNSAFAWARIAGTFNDVKKAFPAPVAPVDKMTTGMAPAI